MKKKVLALIIILTAVVSLLLLGNSFGWFLTSGGDEQLFRAQTIDYGDMDISLVGGCQIRPVYTNITDPTNPVEYAAPGANMIHIEQSENVWVPGPLTMLNKSTILTNLRVHIEYSCWNATLNKLELKVYSPSQKTDFSVDFAVATDWVYDAGTECWNYVPGGNPIPSATDLVNGDEIVLIKSMGYSAALLPGNKYETLPVTVKLKVEAKQAEYATWQQIYDDESP